MSKLIFGCGYLGGRVASRWLDSGEQVFAVTRSTVRADQLRTEELHPIVGNLTEPSSIPDLPQVDTVLFAVGFDRSSGQAIQQVYVDGLRNVLSALPDSVQRLIYVSSTGVYGQTAGEWLDEQSPCNPLREGGIACRDAEQLLREHTLGERTIILRMAGIYGPGRIPRRAELIAGASIATPHEGYLNLIHVDDAAEVVTIAERMACTPSSYLVSDGNPVSRRDYFRELAELLGAPPPTFSDPPADSPAARRALSSKRISNRKLVEQLRISFSYPSYREGLAAIVRDETRAERESQ